jgi:hypothetical protein
MSPTPIAPAADAGEAYRFTRFRTALLIDDLTFDRNAPAPGDHLPAFDLPGRLSRLFGRLPKDRRGAAAAALSAAAVILSAAVIIGVAR